MTERPRQGGPNQKPRKYGIAIGPIDDNPNEMVKMITRGAEPHNQGQQINIILEPQLSPDKTFVVFAVSSLNEARALNDFNGDHNIFISSADIYTWAQTTEILIEYFPKFLNEEKTALDLSSLNEYGIKINLNMHFNTSFVLFYCGLRCKLEGIQITKIIYQRNNIEDTEGFYPASIFFPHLKTLVIDTSVIVTEQFREAASHLNIVQTDEIFMSETTGPSYCDTIQPPQIFAPYTYLTDPQLTERKDEFSLEMYESVQLDPESFPACPLIIQFYEDAWNDISQLVKFYATDSIFTVSVNYHGPNSFLSYYDKFSRNLLYGNNVNNIVKGHKNIVKAQKELFGNHFYARVTSFNGSLIAEPHYIISTAHGVFQVNEYILGFDRTMLIFFNEENAAILNDHIFIHQPAPPSQEE